MRSHHPGLVAEKNEKKIDFEIYKISTTYIGYYIVGTYK